MPPVAWVSMDPDSGTIAPGAYSNLPIVYDATDLTVGTYYARLYSGRGDGKGWLGYGGDVLGATLCLPAAVGGLPAAITLGSQIRQKTVSGMILNRLSAAGIAPQTVPSPMRSEP